MNPEATAVETTLAALLNGAFQNAQKSAQADAEETAKFALAALNLTQAYVALHPGLVSPQGVTPLALNPPQTQQPPQSQSKSQKPPN